MASAVVRRHIAGVTVELTRAEVYGIVNTAERLGEMIESLKEGQPVSAKAWRDTFFADPQGFSELVQLFEVSKAVSVMFKAEGKEEVCPL